MNTIWKYRLNIGFTTLRMPRGAQVLTVQTQDNEAYLWAKVNPAEPLEDRKFAVYGTGHEMPDDPRLIYVGTFQMRHGLYVWHLFDATFTN